MIFYHGTCTSALPSIMREGLLPKVGKGADAWLANAVKMHASKIGNVGLAAADRILTAPKEVLNAVFLTRERDMAEEYASFAAAMNGSKPVLLRVNLPDDLPNVTISDRLNAEVNGPVPASCIVGKPIAVDFSKTIAAKI